MYKYTKIITYIITYKRLSIVAFTILSLGLAIFSIYSIERVEAAFNPEINYQGRLVDSSGDPVPDGVYHMRFKLYTTLTGGAPIWTEDRSTAEGDRVVITNGLFSLMLGSSTPLTASDFDQALYLSVEIGGSGGSPVWDGEMNPRKVLGAVPAAFIADTLDGLDSLQFLRSDILNTSALFTRSTTTHSTTTNAFVSSLMASQATTTNLFSNIATFDTICFTGDTCETSWAGGGGYDDTDVNDFIHASTTIPKTYTSNIFTNANIFDLITRSTTTQATTTNLFATTGIFTNLFANTANLTEAGGNEFFTNSRVQTYLDTVNKGYFFSTTSASHFLSLNQGSAFSTTSASNFLSLNQGLAFSTTSASYFLGQNQDLAFSTTSVDYWESEQWRWATSSADYHFQDSIAPALVAGHDAEFANATITHATTSTLFSGTASSTNLFSTNAAIANLFANTANLTEAGGNEFFTGARVQTYLDGVNKGFFFSTTSASHFLSLNQGFAFSTTSADYYLENDGLLSGFNAIFGNSTTTNLYIDGRITGAGLTACDDSDEKLLWNAVTGQFYCGADAGAGGGITSLGAEFSSFQNGASQTFSTSTPDDNLRLTITSDSDEHQFALSWFGTLADSRVADNLTISGGTINNTPIGASSASTAIFTNSTTTNATTTSLFSTTASSTNLYTTNLFANTANLTESGNLFYTDARVNSYINGSTTIPKTYTSNIFTNANIFDLITRSTTTQATSTSLFATLGNFTNLCISGDCKTAWPTDSTASSTLLSDNNTWTGGNLFNASTTIGNGTQAGGLTINGGATTTGNAYFAGNVGVGTSNPLANLHINTASIGEIVHAGQDSSLFTANLQDYLESAQYNFTSLNNSASRAEALQGLYEDDGTGNIWGLIGVVESTHSAGMRTTAQGIEGDAYNSGAGDVASLVGVSGFAGQTGSGTVGDLASFVAQSNSRTSGTVSRNVGLLLRDQSGVANVSTSDYQIYSSTADPFVVRSDGNVGVGTDAPSQRLHVSGNFLLTGNSTSTNATTTNFFSTTASSTNLFTSLFTLNGFSLTATANSSIAGTNTGDVTLTGTPDYITISGQTITRNKLDISDDTNATGGTGINISANDLTFDCSEVEGTGIDCVGEAITLDTTGSYTWTGANIFNNITRSTTTQATTTNFFSNLGNFTNLCISGDCKTAWPTDSTASSTLLSNNNTFSGSNIFDSITRSTTTQATTTNLFSTTASSTNLYTTNLFANTANLSESGNLFYTDTRVNSYINGSSTIPKTYSTNLFTGANIFSNITRSTTTSATTTSLFSTTASSTNLFSQLGSIGSLTLGDDLTVANGGTGASTLTGILLGNGTSPFTGLTTSAGIFGAISDETGGSGVLVGSASPAFTGTPTMTGFLSTASSTISASSTITGVLTASGGVFGNLTGNVTGNLTGTASLATALAGNGTNCSSGQAAGGVDASGNAEDCTDYWTEAENTSAAYTPQSRTITINGTAGQITSSAGAQDLSANRTWTISLPSFVQISNLTVTNSTTTNATSTNATSTNFFSTLGNFTNLCISGDCKTAWPTDLTASTTLLVDNNTFSGANTFTGANILNNITRSTTTSATTTNLFSTTASSTNLFSTSLNTGNITSGTINGQTIGTISSLNQLLVTSSTTLQNFTFLNATGTNATTTNFFSTTASTTNFFGAGLSTCTGTNKLTWTGGTFVCATDSTASSTLLANNNTFSGANIFDLITRSTTTQATTTNLFSTTASSTNLFSSLLTVGGNALVVDANRNTSVGGLLTLSPANSADFGGTANTISAGSGAMWISGGGVGNGIRFSSADGFIGPTTDGGMDLGSLSQSQRWRNLYMTGSAFVGGSVSITGNSTTTHATTTTLFTGTASTTNFFGAGLSTCTTNNVLTWSGGSFGCEADDSGSGSAYPFELTGNATSTLTQFNAGLTAFASSTIGNGTQAGGLTINGGATTTGNAYFAGNVGIGTSTPSSPLTVQFNSSAPSMPPVNIIADENGNDSLRIQDPLNVHTFVLRNIAYQQQIDVSGDLMFKQFGETRMTIEANSGNVGIGTDGPQFPLDVAGNKIGLAGMQMLYVPDQTDFLNSLFVGSGGQSLEHNSDEEGQYNTGVGLNALDAVTTGAFNTALGTGALQRITTGSLNIGIGPFAMSFGTEAGNNIAIGRSTLQNNVTGNGNIALGNYALQSNEAHNNIGIGYFAGSNITSGSNNIAIGEGIQLPSATESGQLSIGNLIFGTGLATGSTVSSGNVGIGTTTPQGRLNIYSGASGATANTTYADDLVVENSDNAGISILAPDNKWASLYLGSPSKNTFARIEANYDSNDLNLATEKNGAAINFYSGNLGLAMTILGNGNVSINSLSGSGTRCVQTDDDGVLSVAGDVCGSGGGGSAYPFGLAGNATSTLTQFNGGITAFASSTIGNGTGLSGLTINGNSTTTGNAYFAGNVGIGTASPAGKLHVLSSPGDNILIERVEDSGTSPASMIARKARGTVGSRTAVQENDRLFFLTASGYVGTEGIDGSYSANMVGMNFVASEAFTSIARGTHITFETTAPGTVSRTEKLRITGNGNVGVGTTTPTYALSSFSATAPQLALSAGTGIAQWAFRNAGGNLYIATTTVAGTATTSISALSIIGASGQIGIGTDNPQTTLHVKNVLYLEDSGLKIGGTTGNTASNGVIANITGSSIDLWSNSGTKFRNNSGQLFAEVALSGTGLMRLYDGDFSAYVGFKSPSTVSSSVEWTLPDADANGCFRSDGAGNMTIGDCGGSTTQTVTSADQDYALPSGALMVVVEMWGGGGGGGGGAASTASNNNKAGGGGGGGGGAFSTAVFVATELGTPGTTVLKATAGSGGVGGAETAGATGAGNVGTAGGRSCLSTTSSCGGTVYINAYGGGGGSGGLTPGNTGSGGGGGGGGGSEAVGGSSTTATGGTGGGPGGGAANSNSTSVYGGGGGGTSTNTPGAGGQGISYGGGGGGAASNNGANASALGGSSLKGGSGGGSGGSTNGAAAASTATSGSTAGLVPSATAGGGAAGGTAGANTQSNGTNGTTGIGTGYGGGGGGGGASRNGNGVSGYGGDGAIPAGGGGGGGASRNNGTLPRGGGGGDGGRGHINIITIKSSPADLAEVYSSNDASITAGDVVSIDPTLNAGVKKSDKAYDPKVVGIISTSPSMIMGGLEDPGARPVLVALAGRVPVKVSLEGGTIKPGDYLTPSSIPGVAMKATKFGPMLGQAMVGFDGDGYREEINGQKVGMVVAFLKNGYGGGSKLAELVQASTTGQSVPDDSLPDSSDIPLPNTDFGRQLLLKLVEDKLATDPDAEVASEIFTDRIGVGLEIISPRVVTDNLVVNSIESVDKQIKVKLAEGGEFLITFDDAEAPLLSIDSLGNAIFAGGLTVGTPTKPNGITLYDTETGEPYCSRVTAGQMVTSAGRCEDVLGFPLGNTASVINSGETGGESGGGSSSSGDTVPDDTSGEDESSGDIGDSSGDTTSLPLDPPPDSPETSETPPSTSDEVVSESPPSAPPPEESSSPTTPQT